LNPTTAQLNLQAAFAAVKTVTNLALGQLPAVHWGLALPSAVTPLLNGQGMVAQLLRKKKM